MQINEIKSQNQVYQPHLISFIPQNHDNSIKNTSQTEIKKELMKSPENAYHISPIKEQKISINLQKNTFFDLVSIAKNKISAKKITIKDMTKKVLNDEEYIHKKFPNFKIEKMLLPGESYGEVGIEYMTRKLIFL